MVIAFSLQRNLIMPDVRDSSDDSDFVATAAEDDRYAELLLAGFRACAREAIRFLLEEEGLSPDHPLPSGLNEHLVRQQCHLAGTLHNDSGVDFDESFLSCSPDGDTTPPRKRRCIEKETDTGEVVDKEIGVVQSSEDASISKATEEVGNCEKCETESVHRTEGHTLNQN